MRSAREFHPNKEDNMSTTPNITRRTRATAFVKKGTRRVKVTNHRRIETVLAAWEGVRQAGACLVGMVAPTYMHYDSCKDTSRVRNITNPHWPVDKEKPEAQTARIAAALKICSGCKIRTACRAYAMMVKPVGDGFVMGGVIFISPNITKKAVRRGGEIVKPAVYETMADVKTRIVNNRHAYNASLADTLTVRTLKNRDELAAMRIAAPAMITVAAPARVTSDHSAEYVYDLMLDLLVGKKITDAVIDTAPEAPRELTDLVHPADAAYDESPTTI
jgi:hypothetical protein